MRLRAPIALLLLLGAGEALAAYPLGGSPGTTTTRSGEGRSSFSVYMNNGEVVRAKRMPVFLYGRVVFTLPDGKPVNIPDTLVDRNRTLTQGKAEGREGRLVTNRSLKDLQAGFNPVEIGDLDEIEARSSGAGRLQPEEPGATEEAAGAPKAKQRTPGQDYTAAEVQSLQRNLAELQRQLTELRAQKRTASGPGSAAPPGQNAAAAIDQQIAATQDQINETQRRISELKAGTR